MLFSEPKIPQCAIGCFIAFIAKCFSALQRAENSSISIRSTGRLHPVNVSVLFSEPKIPQYVWNYSGVLYINQFQCSSASRKFLNLTGSRSDRRRIGSFSALQRAENSSISAAPAPTDSRHQFQCSSASRKFLNLAVYGDAGVVAEFQCSSASRKFLNDVGCTAGERRRVWFQCSSASRKFLNRLGIYLSIARSSVSVLFSEPKIPQFPSLAGG